MRIFANRFLSVGADVIDGATGETVRLWIADGLDRAAEMARASACDRLAELRHPLLLPPLDYGHAEGRWFEAYPAWPALRAPASLLPQVALHAVRFLRAEGVELTADLASRIVRPAIEQKGPAWRPLGVRLQPRHQMDALRAAVEEAGPPGVTGIIVAGRPGSGLRTILVQIARLARLAGFLVLDTRLAAGWHDARDAVRGRHVCALDWVAGADREAALAWLAGAAGGARRHLCIRFVRREPPCDRSITLTQLGATTMRAMIYQDAELGPRAVDVTEAVRLADGLPGPFIARLTAGRAARHAHLWVHEVSPAYVVRQDPHDAPPLRSPGRRRAGVDRLERAVRHARGLMASGRHAHAERTLRRAGSALAAREEPLRAADAACLLGDLCLDRGRPDAALAAFNQAREWCADAATARRSLIGTGRGMFERGQLLEAEAAFRTAMNLGAAAEPSHQAAAWLADVLVRQGRSEEALGLLSGLDGDVSLPSAIHGRIVMARACLERGDAGHGGRIARDAIEMAESSGASVLLSEAHLTALASQAVLRDRDAVERHGREAVAAARRARAPVLLLRAAASGMRALSDCGIPMAPARRQRLLRAAARLPALWAGEIRSALEPDGSHGATVALDTAGAVGTGVAGSAVRALESLLDLIDAAPDDVAALRATAEHVRAALGACTVTVVAAAPIRTVAFAGRSWPAELQIAERVVNGGGGVFRDGVAPEAAEPIRCSGTAIGAIAARWIAGTRATPLHARELLRIAAAASASPLRLLASAAVAPAAAPPQADDLFGPSVTAETLRAAIRRAASVPYPVLIEGESGCGKELAARAIHARGVRRPRRFCAVNCAALSDDLIEAELFGHSRGAFTGAVAERAGLFEEADGGTLFLDEVGELSPRAQAKLLRVLQEGEVRRVGESVPRRVDVRIVAATNRSLQHEVQAGRFRPDLRFRLDVIRLDIPPLRERPDDVPWLAGRFWSDAASRVGTRATLSPELMGALARYDWPGNVRELQNVIAALAVHGPMRGRVAASLLPAHVAGLAGRSAERFEDARLEFERRYVRAALARAGGQRTAAAAQLGVSRQGLAKMLKRLGLED